MRKITVAVEGRPPTPNSRRDWHVVAKDNKQWKDAARIAAGEAMVELGWDTGIVMVSLSKTRIEPRVLARVPMLCATLDVTIVVPDAQRRDLDNGICSLKPLLDGCVASGVITDDSIAEIVDFRCHFVKQKGGSKVILKFTEVVKPGSLGL